MVKEVEKLIKIVGKGNLLEAAFIYLGSFQHADLQRHMDHRNHNGLSEFINKKEQEPLDKYFNLKFSLQGLFLIYAQAHAILSKDSNLGTQDIIDKICNSIKELELDKDINEVANGRKLDLLNTLANPKREPIFKTEGDFESKILTDIKKLLNEKSDEEFYFNKFVIDCYYSIHQDIKVDEDLALLFSLLYSFGGQYKKSLSPDRIVKREILELRNNPLIESYIGILASLLHYEIKLANKDGTIEYVIDHKHLDLQKKGLEYSEFELYPINAKNTLEQLLKNQDSDEFERLVTSPKNICYSALSEENECITNFVTSKKNHKNTFYKLALGMFILSVGLYVADYFLMEQKLFNSMKNILPQTNLIIAAVLTIVIVYALFQLSQKPPLSTVNGMKNENLEQLHAKQA